jgi:hypothetical protein
MSAANYIQEALRCLQLELSKAGKTLKGKPSTPMQSNYRPELDISPILDPEQANYYMSLIGILRWAVELGRIDIYIDVCLLSSYMCQPQVGHLEQLLHIFAYLKHHENSNIVFDPNYITPKPKPVEKIEKKFHRPYSQGSQRGTESGKNTLNFNSVCKESEEKPMEITGSRKKPANFQKEINTMKGHQNNSTISSTVSSDLVLFTARTCKSIHGAEQCNKATFLPSATASSTFCPPSLYPKFPSAPIRLSKWTAPFSTATPADTSQPFPEATSTFKPFHHSWPQPEFTIWKKSIPNTSESLPQITLNISKKRPPTHTKNNI